MKRYILVMLANIASFYGMACTTFLINNNGQLVFGRNYDWISGAGIIHSNQRGLFKTSAQPGNGAKLSWVSLFGSLTFNQYGKEFPTGGMNEKGLVVELMWLEGTQYSPADHRAAMGVLQWIQYQLDNNSTVAEVIASDNKIRIGTDDTPLHYLVADAKGDVASIEFLEGKMVVHRGDQMPYPVLTNDTYKKSSEIAVRSISKKSLPGENSLDRFVTACKMINELKTAHTTVSLTDYAFSILDKVAQGDYTKWSIVYDISNKKISFKTADYKNVKSFSFGAFDFACSANSLMFDMNQAASGEIAGRFIVQDKQVKRAITEKAVMESRQYVNISEADKKTLLEFEDGVRCN